MKKRYIALICIVLVVLIAVILEIVKLDLKGQQVPILLYHHFLTSEELKNYDNSDEYAVNIDILKEQMEYLHKNGYESITLDELYKWKKGKITIPKKCFVITIDDGLTSTFRYAKDIFEEYGYTATLFTISSRVDDKTREWNPTTYQYIGQDVIKENDNKTINIQSHSHDLHHMEGVKKAVETYNYDEILNDVKKAKTVLNAKFWAYPFNTYNNNMFKALRKNDFLLAFRGTNHMTYKNEYSYMTSRIFVNNDIEYFKSIFETDKYKQNLIDKVKSQLVHIKNSLFI